ncbi:ComEA family DNA-binding protein [Chroococcidiopsis sp.]|uniref:ComEA family DNA-binding protein n=1 Tax=Chroococcidiopsis sp. TaxID=3088168 RepID=UPI003F2F35E5
MQAGNIHLPFLPGDVVWQSSRAREIVLGTAFSSGGRIIWNATYGDETFNVHESDIRSVPKLEAPLKEGDRVAINKVPHTVLRDAFPGLPGGKGVVARKIVKEREDNGDFKSIEDLQNRMGLSQVNWIEVGGKLDFG